MSTLTQIEWTDTTWNPVTGCTKITRGCDFCYAERFSERFRGVPGHPFENGFDLTLKPERLRQPLAWRKPRRIFVNSMSDLFHKEVPRVFIDAVFDTMEAGDWHTFQVLTKRSSLMARYLRGRYGSSVAPPHIWLGVSVEDRQNAVRVKHLRAAQASLKFVSFEPLLGPIGQIEIGGIDWAIVGGESGPHARPMQEEWAIELRDQCRRAKVAFFFKQWGGIRPKTGGRLLRGREWNEYPNSAAAGCGEAIVADPYSGREQTKAKHFILRRYLQALAFKVLGFSDITYVDGFSGPWETQTEDFADSSFMIAIQVLRDAQQRVQSRPGKRPKIRCFFSENGPKAFKLLTAAVAPFNKPQEDFEIRTYCGDFEDAVSEIQDFIGRSFPLFFIDPTGWTGYAFDKIGPLFHRAKCEVVINFMYDFVIRAASMSDPKTIASLDPILGGPNWESRLDPKLSRGRAIEKLFRDTLRQAGRFEFVVSTKIDRPTKDRPHFFLAYGTKSEEGLKAFRETEHTSLGAHARDRADAKARKREEKTGISDMFTDVEGDAQESSIEEIVEEQKLLASEDLVALLKELGPMKFARVWALLLEPYMLRVTNVKDICVALAKAGKIKNSWGGGNRKPRDEDLIALTD